MRLKNFDLDLPHADRETRRDFRWRSRSISALYERCLPKTDVPGAWKILIECVEQVERSDVRDLTGVLILQRPLDYQRFQKLEPLEQKKMLLEVLHQGSLRIAELRGWSLQPFEAAYRCAVDRDYVNEWTWPQKARLSPDRKHQALLLCSHEMDRFRAWIVIQERKGNELVRSPAIDEPPNDFLFVPKMGKLTWVSNDRIVLLDKKGAPVAEASVSRLGCSAQC